MGEQSAVPEMVRPSRQFVDALSLRFSQATIPDCFSDWNYQCAGDSAYLDDVVSDLNKGYLSPSDFPPIRVVRCCDRCYSLDNRRLYVLQQHALHLTHHGRSRKPLNVEVDLYAFEDLGSSLSQEEQDKLKDRDFGKSVILRPTLHQNWQTLFEQAIDDGVALLDPLDICFAQRRISSKSCVRSPPFECQELQRLAGQLYESGGHANYKAFGELCVAKVSGKYYAIDNQKLFVFRSHAQRCYRNQQCKVRVFVPPKHFGRRLSKPYGDPILVDLGNSCVWGSCHKCHSKWTGAGCSCFDFDLELCKGQELGKVDDWVWVPSPAELRTTWLHDSTRAAGNENLAYPAAQVHPSSGHVSAGEETLTSALNEQWSSLSAATFATKASDPEVSSNSTSLENLWSGHFQGEGLALLSSSVCISSP